MKYVGVVIFRGFYGDWGFIKLTFLRFFKLSEAFLSFIKVFLAFFCFFGVFTVFWGEFCFLQGFFVFFKLFEERGVILLP